MTFEGVARFTRIIKTYPYLLDLLGKDLCRLDFIIEQAFHLGDLEGRLCGISDCLEITLKITDTIPCLLREKSISLFLLLTLSAFADVINIFARPIGLGVNKIELGRRAMP